MKKTVLLPALALALASCAPTVQQDPVYTKSQTYTGTCAEALAQLDAVAIRTRPAVLFGVNSWTPLKQTSKGENGAAYVSTNSTSVVSYGVVTPIGGTVTVVANCSQVGDKATVTLSSSGQQQNYINTLNDALLKGITLPQ